MEFAYANYINTTTAISIATGGNTAGAGYLYSTEFRQQFITDGASTDASTASIRINFDVTKTVSRLALVNTNLKSFRIFYNGATANTFALTSTSATTTCNFSTNSETSLYFFTTPVSCTSVSIDMISTQSSNNEKAIGWFYIGDVLLDFPRIPSAQNYSPILDPERIEHELSDGGTRIQTVRDVWRATVKFDFITTSFRNSLKTVYDLHNEFVFAPFGTTTAWDGIIIPCVWSGPFDFHEYSDNASSAGFSGGFTVRQIPV